MAVTTFPKSFFHGRIETASRLLFWSGLAMAVLGIAAIIFPMASTLVVTLIVGWMFLLFGVIQLFGSFSIHGTGPFFGALLVALLTFAAGVFLLANPVAAETSLTLVVAFLFSLQGASEVSFAFEIRPFPAWVGMLISGVISIGAAVLIVAAWPAISGILLGLVFGINFLSTGLANILVSRALKRLP